MPVVVKSMASLMELGLEDGKDAMIISNTHISILCLVTSKTGAMNFDTRKLVLPRYWNSVMRTWYPAARMYIQRLSPADSFE